MAISEITRDALILNLNHCNKLHCMLLMVFDFIYNFQTDAKAIEYRYYGIVIFFTFILEWKIN